jgi:hypothetical protein
MAAPSLRHSFVLLVGLLGKLGKRNWASILVRIVRVIEAK